MGQIFEHNKHVTNEDLTLIFPSATIITAGIRLTGFSIVHWLLYIPPVMFTFAAVTGICPEMIFSKVLFKEKEIELKKI